MKRLLAVSALAGLVFASGTAANAMVVAVDQVTVYKNGGIFFNDTFDDGNPPPSAPNFGNGTGNPASYFEYGNATEAGGKALLYGEVRDAQGRLTGPQGALVTRNTVTDTGVVIFSNDLVRESGIRLLSNSGTVADPRGLKVDDEIVAMALFDMQAPTTLSSNFGLTLTDQGGSGTRNDRLNSSVARRTGTGEVSVRAWRADVSQVPVVLSEFQGPPAELGHAQILFRQSKVANSNQIHAEFAYVDTANFDLTDQAAINGLSFQSLGTRTAFDGEDFTRVEVRVLERVAEAHVLSMTTASPTSVSQTVSTGSTAFEMTFNYRFETLTGTLDVILDGTTIGTYLAPGTLSGSFTSASILIDSPLLDLTNVDLEFQVTNPTTEPSTVLIDSVFFPGIVNGDFGDGTDGWQITSSNPSSVGVQTFINSAPTGVPEPAALLAFGLGLAGLGLSALSTTRRRGRLPA